MKLATVCLLSVAVAGLSLAGCQGDESARSRPRTKAILPSSEQGRENAEKRELEAPKRNMPTSGSEFPGQSRTNTKSDGQVLTLGEMYGTNYHGPLPMLAEKPGMTPAVGYTPIEGSPWVIEHSWGETLPLADYNHRAWPDTKTTYVLGGVKGNPTYAMDLPNMPRRKSDACNDAVTTVVAVPWFYCNTFLLPVLMCFECPLKPTTTSVLGQDPLYLGYLPATGAIVPSPMPGEFKFRTDFENPETQPSTMSSPTGTAPATVPAK